jgi:hypothetical protein
LPSEANPTDGGGEEEYFCISFRLSNDMIDNETNVIIIKIYFRCYRKHVFSLLVNVLLAGIYRLINYILMG